jgi:PIN domain nuclease of toxin-antitoxin system
VRLLLDTHVFLWLQTDPERLGEHLRVVEDRRTELLFSAVSSWEIAIKYQLGKLPLPEPPEQYVPERMRAIGAQAVAVEHPHALAVAALPPLHRDPFDRLLVAQAMLLGLTIATADLAVAQYATPSLLVGATSAES